MYCQARKVAVLVGVLILIGCGASEDEQCAQRMMAFVAAGDKANFDAEYFFSGLDNAYHDCRVVVAAAELERKPLKYSTDSDGVVTCRANDGVFVCFIISSNRKAYHIWRPDTRPVPPGARDEEFRREAVQRMVKKAKEPGFNSYLERVELERSLEEEKRSREERERRWERERHEKKQRQAEEHRRLLDARHEEHREEIEAHWRRNEQLIREDEQDGRDRSPE